jgi:hypothetical protein
VRLRQRLVDGSARPLNLGEPSGFILGLYRQSIQPVLDCLQNVYLECLYRLGVSDETRKAGYFGPVAATLDLVKLGNALERDAQSASQ